MYGYIPRHFEGDVSNECPPSFHTAVNNDRIIVTARNHELAVVREIDAVNAVCVLPKDFGHAERAKYFVR